jgi:DmsE family decaheme c-type cytochrome
MFPLIVFAAALFAQDYAGTEMCQACHEDIAKAFLTSNRHGVLETNPRKGWETKSCEACHGAGAKHAESADASLIRNPRKLGAAGADKACMTCHGNQPARSGRVVSGHARQQLPCTSCHSIHAKAPEPKAQCGGCHSGEKAGFFKPHAHPVPQGAMSCVDCHNPHGTVLSKSLNTAIGNEPGCLRCHGDKRGPFAFEHAPVRLEGCGACHEAHGSVNPRMLTRPAVSQLCLECHAGTLTAGLGGVPPAFHDLRTARYRSCTTCHMKIHGSHVNRALLR